MYPATLHKNPTQNLDFSQIDFSQQNDEKLVQKDN